jgi:hypothetical protein
MTLTSTEPACDLLRGLPHAPARRVAASPAPRDRSPTSSRNRSRPRPIRSSRPALAGVGSVSGRKLGLNQFLGDGAAADGHKWLAAPLLRRWMARATSSCRCPIRRDGTVASTPAPGP